MLSPPAEAKEVEEALGKEGMFSLEVVNNVEDLGLVLLVEGVVANGGVEPWDITAVAAAIEQPEFCRLKCRPFFSRLSKYPTVAIRIAL